MTTKLDRLKELVKEMAEDNAFPYREVGAAWPDILRVLEASAVMLNDHQGGHDAVATALAPFEQEA